jgi:adenosylcobinamide-phosphate synthase
MIVGRDTAVLDADGVARAPSKALPKAFAMARLRRCSGWWWRGCRVWAYKALNTADSLIGHPEP